MRLGQTMRLGWALRRPMRPSGASTYSTRWLAWLLQRATFMTHLSCLFLAALGPVFEPRLVFLIIVGVHIAFACCQVRTAYGMWACWNGVRAHAARDWRLYWSQRKEDLQRQRKAAHVLDLHRVEHIILVPAYKEESHTLRETLDVLASHPLAARTYRVCLGMEEREHGSAAKAEAIIKRYRKQNAFLDVDFSVHPGDIVGESAGKSSNIAWAARHMASRTPSTAHFRQIITVMDADTCFAADYFLAASVSYSLAPPSKRRRTMFVPPILFDRNSPDVPVFVRVADIFWACAGIGTIYPGSTIKVPTSAYSVSLDLAKHCDFWDTGPEAIGEDMHFFCKALFETKGNLNVETIYSPASQCNVVGTPAYGLLGNYLSDCRARWTQAVRHMWGSLDSGYVWYRILTGSFGPSKPGAGYAAVGGDGPESCLEEDDLERGLSVDTGDLLPVVCVKDGEEVAAFVLDDDSGEADSEGDNDSATLVGRPSPISEPAADKVEGVGRSGDAKVVDADDYSRTNDDVVSDDRQRWWPFLVLITRVYEAHQMVAHVFILSSILTIYPTVVYRDGSLAIADVFHRQASWQMAMTALRSSPMMATVNLPSDLPFDRQPIWLVPDLVVCGLYFARVLGFVGIVATVFACVLHDLYHHAAATERWRHSQKALAEWKDKERAARRQHPEVAVASSEVPARYLGIRPARTCKRKWPIAALDFLAIPAGLAYGVAPMIWAQLNHLVTNRLAYTVSAKPKALIVVPASDGAALTVAVADRRSFDGRPRLSLDGRTPRLSSLDNVRPTRFSLDGRPTHIALSRLGETVVEARA